MITFKYVQFIKSSIFKAITLSLMLIAFAPQQSFANCELKLLLLSQREEVLNSTRLHHAYHSTVNWVALPSLMGEGHFILEIKWNPDFVPADIKDFTIAPPDMLNRTSLESMQWLISHNKNYAIWPFTLKNPALMSLLGIYANDLKIIMPNAPLQNKIINSLIDKKFLVGPRFIDLPSDKITIEDQKYSNHLFFENFVNGHIILASRSFYLYHDRFQEHLLGAFFISPKFFKRLVSYAKFVEALSADSEVIKHIPESLKVARDSFSAYWDEITTDIGDTLVGRSNGTLENPKIDRLDRVIRGLGGRPVIDKYSSLENFNSHHFTRLPETFLTAVKKLKLSKLEKIRLGLRIKKLAGENIIKPLTKKEIEAEIMRIKELADLSPQGAERVP
ncbi:MAG: hypothetical protein SGI74_01865 [Oligoflexia bacterium]|nr:hypothetical protein [Oligoflexia bacterium]